LDRSPNTEGNLSSIVPLFGFSNVSHANSKACGNLLYHLLSGPAVGAVNYRNKQIAQQTVNKNSLNIN